MKAYSLFFSAETIQKMIANLPPKRKRRIIGEDGEIKTRSQGTISSVSVYYVHLFFVLYYYIK